MNSIQTYLFISINPYLNLASTNATFRVNKHWQNLYFLLPNVLEHKFSIKRIEGTQDSYSIEIYKPSNVPIYFQGDVKKCYYTGNFSGLMTLCPKIKINIWDTVETIPFYLDLLNKLQYIKIYDLYVTNMIINQYPVSCQQLIHIVESKVRKHEKFHMRLCNASDINKYSNVDKYIIDPILNITTLTIDEVFMYSTNIDYILLIDFTSVKNLKITLNMFNEATTIPTHLVDFLPTLNIESFHFDMKLSEQDKTPFILQTLQKLIDNLSQMNCLTTLHIQFRFDAINEYDYLFHHLPQTVHTLHISSRTHWFFNNNDTMITYPSNSVKRLYLHNSTSVLELCKLAALFPNLEFFMIEKIPFENINFDRSILLVSTIIREFKHLKTIDFQCFSFIQQKLPIREFTNLIETKLFITL